ncbi:MAG TPA: 7-carboxy-7-deazaguanine synthase QueE [Pseudomonadales bacterium]|nr:7-carboxy-7-deazaguanine synthase QueE [Pseudomonadales bacterium]
MTSLRITETFYSLQGESNLAGLPTAFVRLTGCPLRCQYCDTAYAFQGGEVREIAEILETVAGYGARHVCVTGGEPLAQPGCLALLTQLCDAGYGVSLETSGALDISGVDSRVVVVLDLKTPGSGEVARNRYENMDKLKVTDQVKFVICDRQDYEWSTFKVAEYNLPDRVSDVLFSASHEQLEASELAAWILADRLPVRMQIQLHKYLWGNKPGV